MHGWHLERNRTRTWPELYTSWNTYSYIYIVVETYHIVNLKGCTWKVAKSRTGGWQVLEPSTRLHGVKIWLRGALMYEFFGQKFGSQFAARSMFWSRAAVDLVHWNDMFEQIYWLMSGVLSHVIIRRDSNDMFASIGRQFTTYFGKHISWRSLEANLFNVMATKSF